MGPIETCDTCMVDVDGKLVRDCATPAATGKNVTTVGGRAEAAQGEAFDLILQKHELYCTVCDNNNGNCTVHNTTRDLKVKHQARPFRPKAYAQDHSNPFYRNDPDQCLLCGRCVEACQNVQVNETLTINWEAKQPRVLWDGGEQIAGSSAEPISANAMRDLIALGKLLGTLDPEPISKFSKEMAEAANSHRAETQPPSMRQLWKRMRSPESRRGLSFLTAMLAALGRATK